MSGPWHEVAARGRCRIVAFESDAGSPARYAVTTCDGAWLRRDLRLSEAHIWLEHFAALAQDVCATPPASLPLDHPPSPRTPAYADGAESIELTEE
jgi:hypothetical protein